MGKTVREYIEERRKLAEQGFVGADGGVRVDKIKEVLKERDKLKEENEKLRQKLDWFNRELKPYKEKMEKEKMEKTRKKTGISGKKTEISVKKREITGKKGRVSIDITGKQAGILEWLGNFVGRKASGIGRSLLDVKLLEVMSWFYGGKQ